MTGTEPAPSARSGRWRAAALGGAAFCGSLLLLVFVSLRTGPAFRELARLRAVDAATGPVQGAAHGGLAALASTSAQQIYDAFAGQGTLFVLLGAWSKLSIGRVGLLGPLEAARLPWLVLSALAPLLVYALARPALGRRVAVLAGLLLALLPRWLHGSVVGGDGIPIACSWLVVLAAYVRSLGPARERSRKDSNGRLCWAVATACALGFGAAVSLAALWVLPLVAVHFWIARAPATRRLAPRGRVPVPAFALFALAFLPAVLLALNPALWGRDVIQIARWLLAPLAPAVHPTLYAGTLVDAPPVPLGYAPVWLSTSLPAVVLVCALLGTGLVLHRGLARIFARGPLRPPRDRHALGALALLGAAFGAIGPALTPAVLSVFPPRAALALPFVALLAAIGLERAARVAAGDRLAALPAALVVFVVGFLGLRAPGTNSASYDVLLGGARSAAARRVFPIGDGSELGVLARRIDALGQSQVTLLAPGVPPGIWSELRDAGRLQTAIVTAPVERPHQLVLERGKQSGGKVVAAVRRDGAALWALVRR